MEHYLYYRIHGTTDQWHDHGDNHKGECNDFQILSFGCQQKEFTYTRLGYNEGGVWFHL